MKEQKITLEDIARRKEEAQKELNEHKVVVIALSRELVAPFIPQIDKTTRVQRGINSFMAVYDGVMIGLKIARTLRKIFKRR